ncbi:elongation of fatty acids protein 3-like [Eucalyptus grandis]|uniref:elongation of fatty acids protein 3-like n=1 Tax=Eucalyptus grandis TaxID=71139 RepID=UPI00192E9CB9|nr:elongation of fatty acids protein 3-like [Eucalyptus grandis]
MNPISSTVEYWLVRHPAIHNFRWEQGRTFASSPLFLAGAVLSYLSLTLLLSRLLPPPALRPHLLKPITALHNLALTLLSPLAMAVGCALSAASQMPDARWVFCFPADTRPAGPTFFWAYVFYLSKMLEFVDTLLIILSGSTQRLTFLHVYHHSTVLVMCYLWLQTAQSLFPVALVTNATVHVVMYSYYLLCAVGVRPRWKRLVTNGQIVQFVFSFAVSVVMLWYHFRGSDSGCSGIWGWCFNAVFNASLLALFVDFHLKNYAAAGKRKRT